MGTWVVLDARTTDLSGSGLLQALRWTVQLCVVMLSGSGTISITGSGLQAEAEARRKHPGKILQQTVVLREEEKVQFE